MTKVKRIPRNASNDDIADGIDSLHECFDEHRELFAEHIAQDAIHFGQLNENIYKLNVRIGAIATAFGLVIDENSKVIKSQKKPIALLTQWEVVWKSLLGIGGVAAIWKFAVMFALPESWLILKALNAYIVH